MHFELESIVYFSYYFFILQLLNYNIKGNTIKLPQLLSEYSQFKVTQINFNVQSKMSSIEILFIIHGPFFNIR